MSIPSFPIAPFKHRMHYAEKALGELFPKEADRLDLSFIYPLISPVALLIKQSPHVAGITTLIGADDQS